MNPSVSDADLEVLHAFPRYQGPGMPGFVIDFFGTKTRTAVCTAFAGCDGLVEGYPVPGNFHATLLEWAGMLRAMDRIEHEVTVVELGAGWGPWLVTAALAARHKGIAKVNLIGIEGSLHHHGHMRTHFQDNGVDPDAHKLLHGVIGLQDGVAEFPVLADPDADYGAKAILPAAPPGRLRRALDFLLGRKPAQVANTEKLPCYSLSTLLAPHRVVDLVHVDIQGSEAEIVPANYGLLGQKVKWLIIGTHGRAIEDGLVHGLAGHGWVLEREEPCMYRQIGQAMGLVRDGCQVWRNPALTDAAAVRSAA